RHWGISREGPATRRESGAKRGNLTRTGSRDAIRLRDDTGGLADGDRGDQEDEEDEAEDAEDVAAAGDRGQVVEGRRVVEAHQDENQTGEDDPVQGPEADAQCDQPSERRDRDPAVPFAEERV